ncbi:TBC1 domain family member 19-like isoform X2 [Dendronephthya gigantea]|uniref:TBC1 domain family member 19-like isoform X2 n=1 Tax=Dendronephthya gigantea TaxID=151771 RepID=UPI00106AD6DA|nr:TBC1 domain family member 19-like isoform X2 [Dendronephthya gigantea]
MAERRQNEICEAATISWHLGRSGRKLYLEMKKDLRELVSSSNVVLSDVKKCVQPHLKSSGWGIKVQNAVYQQMKRRIEVENSNPESCKEPLAFFQKAQASWEKKVLKSINSMCTELSLPLARKRSTTEQAAVSSKFSTLGSECDMAELNKIRPVYSTLDFMEAVVNVKNPNYSPLRKLPSSVKGWGQIKIHLKVKTVSELRSFFKETEHCGSQCGSFDAEGNSKDMDDNEWYKLGKRVIEKGSCPAAQQYAKSGCPSGLRRHIWCLILDVGDNEENKIYFEQLKSYVCTYDLLVDTLIKKDVKSTATNDDQYFVFEDLLYQVLLAFTRDTAVLKHFDQTSASPPRSYIRGKLGVYEYAVFYPPNGIIPFHGFAMYAAPLCYIYENPSRLYHVFRELYTRYFSRLHSISSHPQGIVSLCLLFETLLQSQEPGLFYHLRQIGMHPLKTAFNWMFYAFSGYLESEQVLILWDRVLGYDSLEILAE